MAASVTVMTGPALCGKTTRLLARYRTALIERRFGHTLWLAPTKRGAFDLRGRLLNDQLPACFSPGVMTFGQFAEAVLQASGAAARPVTPAMKRHLVRHVIEDALAAGRLQYFAPIADTPGLIDLVSQWIGELKRLEIWPEEFRDACQKRGLTPKDRELLGLYEAYQHTLTQHDLYDAEGRFWRARELLREGQRRPFENLRLVVADGFTDFTRTQHEILEILAHRVDEVWISLPLEEETRREELFAKTRQTLAELQRRHPQLEVQSLSRPETPAWPALAHLERHLFVNPREAVPAKDAQGLQVLAAAQDYDEIQRVGRSIKDLLTKGDAARGNQTVRPGEVAVVFRRLSQTAPLVREIFERLGLPFTIETGDALDASPALAALVNLLQLDVEDWPFRRLLAVLGSSYFRPDWPEWDQGRKLTIVERVVREHQVPKGRNELLARVTRTAETQPDESRPLDDERLERRRRRQQDAALALPVLSRLAEEFDRLPRQTTPSEWAEAITELARSTGFLRVLSRPVDTQRAANEMPAWDRLLMALNSAEQLAGWLDQSAPQWDRRQLLDAILDALRCEELPASHDETGRVRVLSAASIRTLTVPYLFFAGLSETAMPSPDREDRLYSDAEYQQLHALGLPVLLRRHRSQEEMLLFYEVVTRASRCLQLSYPALDEKAQPLLPSPYVREVEHAMGPALKVEKHLDPSPLPKCHEPQSTEDLRRMAVLKALEGDSRLLATLIRDQAAATVGRHVLAALRTIGNRARKQGFGDFEGVLRSTAAQAWLGQRYGEHRLFSASHLETYASCPFRFFLAQVLRLRELPDVGLDIDFMQRGYRLHEVLAQIHRRLNELNSGPLSPAKLSPQQYLQHVQQVIDELLQLSDSDASLVQAMAEIDRHLLHQWLQRYQDQHQQYEKKWETLAEPPLPAHFEVSFGMPVTDGVDPLSREEPLVISVDGVTVRLSGRIDRIDVGQLGERAVFNILDYKSGRPRTKPKDAALDGTALQLELYAIAVQELLLVERKAHPWEAGYWYIKEKGYKTWFAAGEVQEAAAGACTSWSERRRAVEQKVAALAAGIRAGKFPVYSLDSKCTGTCPYNTVCRINQVRSLEKQWDG